MIIAVDAATGHEFTVFGRPSLESTTSLKKPTAMCTVRVTVKCPSGELEKLLELVRAAKGHDHHDNTPG